MTTWQDLLDRAATDATFRQRVKADPVEAARSMGIEVRDGMAVEVHEEGPEGCYPREDDPNRLSLVLPPLESADGELSGRDLETVLGGKGVGGAATTTCEPRTYAPGQLAIDTTGTASSSTTAPSSGIGVETTTPVCSSPSGVPGQIAISTSN